MLRLDKILVPTDFSDFSRPALDYGCELAARFESELHLLNAIQDPMVYAPEPVMLGTEAAERYMEEQRAAASEALAKLPGGEQELGRPIAREVRLGTAFVEILRYAKEVQIDLIVIGTHGRTGLKHVLLGSVAERVVRMAPCPVLTVRPEGHQFVMP